MIYVLFLLLVYVFKGQTVLFHCDFEIPCADFEIDHNWGVTNGIHSHLIDHDHTLNNKSGIYLFLKSQNTSEFQSTEIKTFDWIEPSYEQAICFELWYYTPNLQSPFDIQLTQGDDENLIRTIASIYEKDLFTNDWTRINIRLPAEKVKILIRLNNTSGSLAFDDLSVHFCDGSRPLPSTSLFSCDGESSCTEDLISLPSYPYQWSTIQAKTAIQQENQAPSNDYTFGNESGHYFWLANSNSIQKGNVGYLSTKRSFYIAKEISYCLNFYYYGYGKPQMSHLKIYARLFETPYIVQQLWPKQSSEEYSYTYNKWTWGIINLPLGEYSLLFRMDSQDIDNSSFALDNISITSCDYLPSEFLSSKSLLSFSCNFDEPSICDIINGQSMIIPRFNFTIFTGNTIPNRELGPIYDYTSKSSSGGFFYWNRQTDFSHGDFGIFGPSKSVEQNTGMCIKFAYYVNSSKYEKNEITVLLRAASCAFENIWSLTINDSQGWQFIIIPLQDYACTEIFYFGVIQEELSKVSVAFDDIRFEQCSLINTTNIIPSTFSTISSTTMRSFSFSITLQYSSQRILSFDRLKLIILCFLFLRSREVF